MKYELTEHAKLVLRERDIPLTWVERVLSAPQLTLPDRAEQHLVHYLGRIAEYDGRVLRIVVNAQQNPVRIVTAFFDRGMRDRL